MASFPQNFPIQEVGIPYRSREFRYLFLYQNAQLKHTLITKLDANANKNTWHLREFQTDSLKSVLLQQTPSNMQQEQARILNVVALRGQLFSE